MSRKKHPRPGVGQIHRDAEGRAFGDRLQYLKDRYKLEHRGDRILNREIAERLSAKLREAHTYSASTVSGWLKNHWVPDTRVMAALADIFGVDVGWLAFGEKTDRLSPEARQRDVIERSVLARVGDVLRAVEVPLDTFPIHETRSPEPRAEPGRGKRRRSRDREA